MMPWCPRHLSEATNNLDSDVNCKNLLIFTINLTDNSIIFSYRGADGMEPYLETKLVRIALP